MYIYIISVMQTQSFELDISKNNIHFYTLLPN